MTSKLKAARTKPARALAALGALLALAAGAVALGGCGASATLDPIARAAEVTSRQAGARISLSMQFSAPSLPGSFTIAASGYFDERERSGVMHMDLSHIPGLSALAGGGAPNIQMVFKYPVIYMNMPFLAGKLPEGKTWMKLDLARFAKTAGIDPSQLSSFDQADPTQFLQYLRASSGSVVIVGHEKVDGVASTHYYATLELSRILDRLPDGERDAARAGLEKLGAASSIPVEVWVDAQGRVRREQLSFSGAGASAGIGGSVTIDFTSYGPVPPILAPAANEVFDATAAAGAGLARHSQGGF
jgi:hypothetical protein